MVKYPLSQDFARGIRQALNLVKIVMIQTPHDRLGGSFNVTIINQISLGWIDIPFDDDIETKRVPM